MRVEYLAAGALGLGAAFFIVRRFAVDIMLDRCLERLVKKYDGVNAKDQPSVMAKLIAPKGPPGAAAFFLQPNVKDNANSSCGVVALGMFRELASHMGVTFQSLSTPLPLDWWSPFVELAKRSGVYHQDDELPTVGSVVHVEGGGPGRHWYTVIAVHEDGSVDSIDGGKQTAGGYQAIGINRGRKFKKVATPAGPRLFDMTSGKNVFEWIDSFALIKSVLL